MLRGRGEGWTEEEVDEQELCLGVRKKEEAEEVTGRPWENNGRWGIWWEDDDDAINERELLLEDSEEGTYMFSLVKT